MSMDNTPRPDGPQLAGATGSDIRSRPEQIIIPEPGSPRHAVDKPFWDIVIGLCCFVCGAPLGGGTWALRWESHRWAHLHCWEERCSSERALGDNPWLSEESARRQRQDERQNDDDGTRMAAIQSAGVSWRDGTGSTPRDSEGVHGRWRIDVHHDDGEREVAGRSCVRGNEGDGDRHHG